MNIEDAKDILLGNFYDEQDLEGMSEEEIVSKALTILRDESTVTMLEERILGSDLCWEA